MTIRTELLEPNKLKLPDNYVADPSNLASMIESVKTDGVMHPPLVKENGEVFAGKMRIIAARVLNLEQVECHVYPADLPDEEYKILSLHENLKRYNLPWYDQVVAEKELHELRQAEHGKGKPGSKVGWSIRDTAKELGDMAFGVLSEDLRIADAIILDPSLKRIQDKTTARKVILTKIKQINQEMGASQRSDYPINVCHHGHSDQILKIYPDNFFDACITDPPWLEFKDASLTRDKFTLPVFEEVFRTLKQNSFLYAFVSTQDWFFYQEELTKIGFSVQKWPLIWIKEGSLSRGQRSWEYQRDYEPIILAVKGAPAVTSSMLSSVASCKVVPSVKLCHPNEKPKEIIKRLLDHCSFAGSIILDPFSGSFVVADTAHDLGRRYVAIEKDAKYYHQGLERLKKDKKNA